MGTNEDVIKKLTVNEGSAAGVVVDAGSVLHETLAGLMMGRDGEGWGGLMWGRNQGRDTILLSE